MSGAVGKAVKPQLRGLLQNQIKRNLAIACTFAIAAAVVQKVLVNDERKNLYAQFYKSYDVEGAFNQLRNRGLFDSCEPDN